jgi:nitrogen regulatory protein P-II 1
MKKIEAIVRPEKVDDIRKALEKAGYPGVTITEVEGHGKQKGVTRQWRGESYKVDLLPKVKFELVVSDKDADRLAGTISAAAKTGSVGDGKIFISDVDQAVRIRTGEKGEDAL